MEGIAGHADDDATRREALYRHAERLGHAHRRILGRPAQEVLRTVGDGAREREVAEVGVIRVARGQGVAHDMAMEGYAGHGPDAAADDERCFVHTVSGKEAAAEAAARKMAGPGSRKPGRRRVRSRSPLGLVELALGLGDDHGADHVAGDVEAGAAHVQERVDAQDHGVGRRDGGALGDLEADGLEHHEEHDGAGARHAGGADGGQGRRDDHGELLVDGQGLADGVADEHGADAQVDGGAVHIDGSAQG